MAKTKLAVQPPAANRNRERLTWIALGAIGLAIGFAVILWFRSPPQMGADPSVFHTVDALYTAVRNRDEVRVAACATQLAQYREAGKLPEASASYLEGVIATARGGGWDAAARQLYGFMIVQRREGEKSHRPAK